MSKKDEIKKDKQKTENAPFAMFEKSWIYSRAQADQKLPPIFIGDTVQKHSKLEVKGEYIAMLGETYYKIENFDGMDPFFMNIVSSSNHWLFISSTGGLSAGRVSAEQSLFPYYTVDKLTENSENTGNKAILLVTQEQKRSLWEPFSELNRGNYYLERNIFKNVTGTAVIFEEYNESLGLVYRYAWRTGDVFGFVKTTWLMNKGGNACQVELVDGIQNILPANVTMATQNAFSPLLDAYKYSELEAETGLAIFALNSTLTDLAEPSESLLATTVAQIGLDQVDYLLSSRQLNQFRTGMGVSTETEVRGQRGAYFAHSTLHLDAGMERTWHLVADVCQDNAAIVHLSNNLKKHLPFLPYEISRDIELNKINLEKIVASADGLQVSSDQLCAVHHFANVMFNVMRGGIFSEGYKVHKEDFMEFVSTRNRALLVENAEFFSGLPSEINIPDLQVRAKASDREELIGLSYAYLPLSFSRRHGDPSRPWNRFAIDIKKPDNSLKFGYEGNWRDIFQNWEALAYSYPEYVESMICTFLNATTVDGYNPYRLTGIGIDWEIPEPNNPWANIGYWSDHQIIYLQKLMEISARLHPGKLKNFLSLSIFSYANVPYRIKSYSDVQKDPFNTIDFDWNMEREIDLRVQELGTDGKLVYTHDRRILRATLAEKLLTLLLAKLANFVPEGGIWMNTQRPEWNDANNALVGKGVSVVTLCYLRRTVVFCKELFEENSHDALKISIEVRGYFLKIFHILNQFKNVLNGSFSNGQRRAMMDELGQAGSDYRWNYYLNGFSGEFSQLQVPEIVGFLDLALQYVEHSLRANKRSDNLYHAYDILHLDNKAASITYLYEMLEGQVSILSSGLLSSDESVVLLESLRHSQLYRPNQHSYILYPDRKLTGFLEKNSLTSNQINDLTLILELVKAKNETLVIQDENGAYHFSGHIRNLKDVKRSLETLKKQSCYTELVSAESAKIEALFEETFHHDEFTGRSGTFFAYEGLGSVYWHMVSKLLLSVQETILRTRNEASVGALVEKYADIRKGLSFQKGPEIYGAFPTDPYSHTPKDQGAKQPGMTGLVKEEILTRQLELGYSIENGNLAFDFILLYKDEFIPNASIFSYWDVAGQAQQIELSSGSIAYTVCQVPIILHMSDQRSLSIHFANGNTKEIEGHTLDIENSQHIFQRDNIIHHLVVSCNHTNN